MVMTSDKMTCAPRLISKSPCTFLGFTTVSIFIEKGFCFFILVYEPFNILIPSRKCVSEGHSRDTEQVNPRFSLCFSLAVTLCGGFMNCIKMSWRTVIISLIHRIYSRNAQLICNVQGIFGHKKVPGAPQAM